MSELVNLSKYDPTIRKRNQNYVADYKRLRGCIDCGESNPDCLDLDHFNPNDKTEAIAILCCKSVNLEYLKEEIAKCDVRCSNCHRKRHAKKRRLKGLKKVLNGAMNDLSKQD